MGFDTIIDRFGTDSAKWDLMEEFYGVPADGGLSMWVADTDFRPPPVVLDKMQALVDHGIFGYVKPEDAYHAAICWWMKTRHDWHVDPGWIFTTTGLVNAIALCLDTFTKPDDGVVLFTPVYHVFAKIIRASGRRIGGAIRRTRAALTPPRPAVDMAGAVSDRHPRRSLTTGMSRAVVALARHLRMLQQSL